MEKLVYRYNDSDESCNTIIYVTFEHISKEDGILALIDKAQTSLEETDGFNFILFDIHHRDSDINFIENNVFTLEEWFQNNKEKI